MDLFEAVPLMHGADERVPVEDLGLAARFYAGLVGGGAQVTKPVPEDKLRLGGMALRNGLLVHGPTHWAAAVRTTPARSRWPRGASRASAAAPRSACPGVRGVIKLAEAMAVIPLVKRALPAARLPMQDAAHARRDGRGGARRAGHPLGRARARSAREAAVALVSLARR